MKRLKISTMLFVLLLCSVLKAQSHKGLRADSIFYQMKKVADWQWKNLEIEGWKNDKKDWTNGAMYCGMMAMGKVANNETYYKKLIQVGEDNKWKTGKYRHFADDYCVGQLYSQLYTIYRNPKYIADFKNLADTIVALPHTESLEWRNKIFTREWAWCDALFMGPPALGYLTEATGDQKYLNMSSKLWLRSYEYLYDKEENLFFRDSGYFNKKEKNGAKVFWSRGNGWVLGGLVRLLSVMPKDHPDRAKLVAVFTDMSAKIASLQQPDGSWHASLLDPASFPIKETSGTGFFCYAFAWGINQGILPYDRYATAVTKAWNALVTSVHPDGKLGFVQAQGASPDKVTYNDTDVYGVGAFLLAGSEMLPLVINQEKNIFAVQSVNTTGQTKKEKVTVSISSMMSKFKNDKKAKFVVEDAISGKTVASELIYDKQKKPVSINFQAVLAPGTIKYFKIKKA